MRTSSSRWLVANLAVVEVANGDAFALEQERLSTILPAGFRDRHGGGVCLPNSESSNAVEVAHSHQGPVLYLHTALHGLREVFSSSSMWGLDVQTAVLVVVCRTKCSSRQEETWTVLTLPKKTSHKKLAAHTKTKSGCCRRLKERWRTYITHPTLRYLAGIISRTRRLPPYQISPRNVGHPNA